MPNSDKDRLAGIQAVQPQRSWCACPRQGDLWLCQGRVPGQPLPAVRNEAGECCALRLVCDVTGRDAWDLAADQLVKRTPCEGCGGDSRG